MTAFHKIIKLNKYTINRDKRKHIYFPKIIRSDRQTTTKETVDKSIQMLLIFP
jgi:hypothetical protein